MWRLLTKDSTEMTEFSEDVKYVSKDSVLCVDFKLIMYDTPTMYGIKGELGWDIVALYLDSYK